jgi:hypothetical protein
MNVYERIGLMMKSTCPPNFGPDEREMPPEMRRGCFLMNVVF